jgi:RNA polymerase sigma-70 factor (ECF subfamily)
MKPFTTGLTSTDDDVHVIYDRTAAELYRYASRLTGGNRQQTQDLVQDTYLHLLQRVRDGRIDAKDVEIGWLVQSCRQRSLEQIRSQRRRHRREQRAGGLRIVSSDAPDADDGVTTALASLTPEHRTALVLRYVDDLPVRDIARTLGRSVRATESLLVRARAALRDSAATSQEARS